MNYTDIEKLYLERVKQWAKRNEQWLASEGTPFTVHAQEIATSALMTRDGYQLHPGGFVIAVVTNNLHDVFAKADTEVRTCLYAILLCYWNVETWDIIKKVNISKLIETVNE